MDWRTIKPGDVLKWGGVVFAYCIGVLVIISIILAMVEGYS